MQLFVKIFCRFVAFGGLREKLRYKQIPPERDISRSGGSGLISIPPGLLVLDDVCPAVQQLLFTLFGLDKTAGRDDGNPALYVLNGRIALFALEP